MRENGTPLDRWIELTVRGLLEDRPDIDPLRAADLRADLAAVTSEHVGSPVRLVRMVLSPGTVGPAFDRIVERYAWSYENETRWLSTRELHARVDGANQFRVGGSADFGVQYCAFAGNDAAAFAILFSTLVPFLSADDLVQAARGAATDAERAVAAWALGAGTPLPSDFAIHYLRRCIRHDAPNVRRAAVEGMAIAGWPTFVPDLRATAETDQDPEVRATAVQAAAAGA
jgi:hypothetical protein